MHYCYFICIDSRSNELIKGVSNLVQDTSQKNRCFVERKSIKGVGNPSCFFLGSELSTSINVCCYEYATTELINFSNADDCAVLITSLNRIY